MSDITRRADRLRRRRALGWLLLLFLAANAMVAVDVTGWSPW